MSVLPIQYSGRTIMLMMTDNFDFNKVVEQLIYNPESPMTFTSGLFLFAFCAFMFIYSMLKNKLSLRVLYTVLFSLFFYYKTSGLYFFLLIFISISDFSIGHILYESKSKIERKLFAALSISINLGILCYFKYTNFFYQIFADIADKPFDPLNIFLPIGISFFTFQSMSYIIDIYRNRIRPVPLWIDYLFYISFFPQLVAGPIVRARDFIPQIYNKTIFITRDMFCKGYFLILIGLFKKSIVSDYISLNFVDGVFDAPTAYSGLENLMAVYGYALQIYCDFSGYSDIAIGIALMLGFKFNKNFDSPYKSATITEFWRRWHISLSSWLKDYLYISLGGNRKGRVRTYLNLAITMLLGGLWHGASIKFVIWGAMHGVGLGVHKLIMERFPSFKAQGADMTSRWRRVVGIIITFNFVCLSWIFFRADNVDIVREMGVQIFTDFRPYLFLDFVKGYRWVLFLMVFGYIMHFLPDKWDKKVRELLLYIPLPLKAVLITLLIWLIMQTKSPEVQPFIYFQF